MSSPGNNNRLEAFCDTIFAIAISLLILEIRIPDIKNVHSTNEVWGELLSQWPSWFSFFLTFITLLIAWVNHHNMLRQLDKTSNLFIYANGFLMLTVVVFPFSAGFLGRFLDSELSSPAIIFYCLTIFIHSVAWLTITSAAISPNDLSRDPIYREKLSDTKKIIFYSCVFNLLVTGLAFWFPTIALCLVSSAWIVYLLPGMFVTSLE